MFLLLILWGHLGKGGIAVVGNGLDNDDNDDNDVVWGQHSSKVLFQNEKTFLLSSSCWKYSYIQPAPLLLNYYLVALTS